MSREVIVIDIETGCDEQYVDASKDVTRPLRFDNMIVPGNLKGAKDNWKSDKLEAQDEAAAVSPLLGRVRCICVGDLAGDGTPLGWANEEEDEKAVLQGFVWFIESFHEAPLFTGWRIRTFDLPFIAFRCAFHEIELPAWWPMRFDRFTVFDAWDWVCDMPGPATASGGYRLSVWLNRFGAESKTGDGAESVGYPIEQLFEYCKQDVVAERQMIRRIAHAVPMLQNPKRWGDEPGREEPC